MIVKVKNQSILRINQTHFVKEYIYDTNKLKKDHLDIFYMSFFIKNFCILIIYFYVKFL